MLYQGVMEVVVCHSLSLAELTEDTENTEI